MPARRAFLGAALALAVPFRAAAALPSDIIAQVEAYLNGIETLRARFVQVAPNGTRSDGKVFMHRPGRMRFEYDPPNQLVILATDWRVVVIDDRTGQTNTIPVARTPLGLILEEPVRLSGDVTIDRIEEVDGELRLTVFKTDEPGLGELELVFGQEPLELRRWRVLDAQGKVTHIQLQDVEINVPLDGRLFSSSNR
ncbi:MAG: outer membrane lipoprotein carrier protein LolA [Pseudomonadota bacterium]